MTIIFPKNNLPEASQPWAREIQKQMVDISSTNTADEINNLARDNQLNSSLLALTGVVNDTKAVLDGLTSLGTSGSLYDINADNITGGTITGVTFQTAVSGTRTVLSGTHAEFYFGANYVGDIIGDDTWSGLDSLAVRNSFGTHGFYTDATSAGIHSPTAFIGVSNAATVSGDGVLADFGGLFPGTLGISGTVDISGSVFMPGLDASTAAANMRWGTGGPGKVQYSTASSRRFKNTIVPIDTDAILDPKKLLDIPVVAFKYNADYLSSDDSRFDKMIPGFIAEDIQSIYGIAAETDGIGATDWNPRYVIPGMLKLIQELYTRIETLEKGA